MRHWQKFKRWKYERWAKKFAAKHGLPFEGIMLLGGYKTEGSSHEEET